MLEDDVQLIRRVLSGDESAFSTLVNKHKKGVHALIWRKVGDFHHAEEITQDVFLQVYRKLGTLKDPKCFAGWLYVIANRLSLNWIQRHTPAMQSLEDTPAIEIEESSYTHYMTELRETETSEHRSEVVKELLENLPESERTVVTLYYLGEMTVKEIGNFLGVSVNTIKSRLRRGRERLQETETLVREVLGSVQLPADLTERIMRQVADMNPVAPPSGKPLVPLVSLGAATILVALMLTASHHYLTRFQNPYSFDASAEPTVEIIDAPMLIDVISRPETRRQLGRSVVSSRNIGAGAEFSEVTLTSTAEEDLLQFSTALWRQTHAPPAGHVRDIYSVSDGTVFAVSRTGIYKLDADATRWTHTSMRIPISKSLMPMAENRGTLYIISTDEIFASDDTGETWRVFCDRPEGDAIGFIITDERYAGGTEAGTTLYLAFADAGIFRSVDGGVQWHALEVGFSDERITALTVIGKTVFAGTNRGLYRLDSGIWRKLPVGRSKAVYSMAVLENHLYVGMGPDLHRLTTVDARLIVQSGEPSSGRIYRSVDLGASWAEITPTGESPPTALPSGVRLVATGDTLLALGSIQFRSTDGGKTWTDLGFDSNSLMLNTLPAVALNDTTFYKAGAFGVHRTTDGGESWHPFMKGMPGRRLNDLMVFNDRLYAHTGYEVYQSTDEGVSWRKVGMDGPSISRGTPSYFRAKFVIAGGVLHFIAFDGNLLRVFRLSEDGTLLTSVQGIPAFDTDVLSAALKEALEAAGKQNGVTGGTKVKTLAMSGDAFYVEYERRLVKWRHGDRAWTDTGLVDLGEESDDFGTKGLKLAVLGETLYVGKREGRLVASQDGGINWRDVTSNLPFHFTSFKEIVFVGATLYVATDAGVFVSETGEDWRVIMDRRGTPIVITRLTTDYLAVDGPIVYGVGDLGTYRLEMDGRWHHFSAEVPGRIVSLGIMNNKLYSATKDRGIFQISLSEDLR